MVLRAGGRVGEIERPFIDESKTPKQRSHIRIVIRAVIAKSKTLRCNGVGGKCSSRLGCRLRLRSERNILNGNCAAADLDGTGIHSQRGKSLARITAFEGNDFA